MTAALIAKLRAARSDTLIANSALIFLTTVLMAGGGAVFWVIAARLASPEDVGLAGSLVAAADSLALFAQLGLNIAILKTMPISDRKAADVTTAAVVVTVAGAGFALIYCLLLPITSPSLTSVLGSPAAIAVYCVLVGATALNVLSDSVFLAINRVRDYLRLNGILLGVVKCTLPFAIAGVGAMGLYGSVGGAIALCAVASLWVIYRHLPGRPSLSPSRTLLDARRFAGAGYVTYVLTVLPLLVFPLLVINALGADDGAAYFISFQIVTLLHAVVLAVANAGYAESERAPHGRRHLVRKSGMTLMVCSLVGAIVMFPLAPYFLQIFGDHYVDRGHLDAASPCVRDRRGGLQLLGRDPAAAGQPPSRDDLGSGAEHGRDARPRRGLRVPRHGLGRSCVGHRAPGGWGRGYAASVTIARFHDVAPTVEEHSAPVDVP